MGTVCFKGTVSRDFRPSVFFSLHSTPGCHDSWAKAVLNVDSNSRRNSIRLQNRLRAMAHSTESIFLLNNDRLRAMRHSAEFKKSFICDSVLCEIQVKSKIFLPTPKTEGRKSRDTVPLNYKLSYDIPPPSPVILFKGTVGERLNTVKICVSHI
jgi:hypothetical protein